MVLNTDLKVNVDSKKRKKYYEAIHIANYLGASKYVYSITNLGFFVGNHDGPCTKDDLVYCRYW